MADEDNIKLTINGKLYEVDVDDLELGEIEVIEDAAGAALANIDFGRAHAIRGLVYVLKHREDDGFTMDDARHLKIGALADPDVEEPDEPAPIKATRRPTGAVKAASSD
jgi:hypothetical protein